MEPCVAAGTGAADTFCQPVSCLSECTLGSDTDLNVWTDIMGKKLLMMPLIIRVISTARLQDHSVYTLVIFLSAQSE